MSIIRSIAAQQRESMLRVLRGSCGRGTGGAEIAAINGHPKDGRIRTGSFSIEAIYYKIRTIVPIFEVSAYNEPTVRTCYHVPRKRVKEEVETEPPDTIAPGGSPRICRLRYASPHAFRSSSALSVRSQVNSGSSRPKWP